MFQVVMRTMYETSRNHDFDTEIMGMALIAQVKLAARMSLAKRSPSLSSLFMEQSFAVTHSLKVKFLKRVRKQPRYTH